METIPVQNLFDFSANIFKRSIKRRKEAEAIANNSLTISSGVSFGSIILIGVGGALLLHLIRGK